MQSSMGHKLMGISLARKNSAYWACLCHRSRWLARPLVAVGVRSGAHPATDPARLNRHLPRQLSTCARSAREAITVHFREPVFLEPARGNALASRTSCLQSLSCPGPGSINGISVSSGFTVASATAPSARAATRTLSTVTTGLAKLPRT